MRPSEVEDLDLLTDNLWDDWAVPYRIKVAMENRRSETATETAKRDFSGLLADSVSGGFLGSWLPEVFSNPLGKCLRFPQPTTRESRIEGGRKSVYVATC